MLCFIQNGIQDPLSHILLNVSKRHGTKSSLGVLNFQVKVYRITKETFLYIQASSKVKKMQMQRHELRDNMEMNPFVKTK